jgi:hypothetical protein
MSDLPALSDEEIKNLRSNLDDTLEVVQVALAQIKKDIPNESK